MVVCSLFPLEIPQNATEINYKNASYKRKSTQSCLISLAAGLAGLQELGGAGARVAGVSEDQVLCSCLLTDMSPHLTTVLTRPALQHFSSKVQAQASSPLRPSHLVAW